MAYVPYAPEIGAKYTLTASDGVTIASFNDSTDPNYVGILDNITGLDSPDVRESGDVLVQTDGGWHGNFYYGRRPIVLTGTCVAPPDATTRAIRLDKIMRATGAMRSDAILSWQNTAVGSVAMQTWVRRQQPTRFTGAWNKAFQIQLVSQYAPLFSVAQHTSATAASVTIENQGSWASYPIITINGASTAQIVVTNTTTGQVFKFNSGFSLGAGASVVVDMLNHTAVSGSTVYNGSIDYVNSTWPALVTGNNTFTVTGAPTMSITWRDNWI